MVGTGSKLYTLLWRCAEHMLLSSLCLIIDGINGASSVSVLYKLLDLFNINLASSPCYSRNCVVTVESQIGYVRIMVNFMRCKL